MNILIIGGSGDSPLPNSVCIKNLAKEFVSRGHSVWVLAAGEAHVKSPGNLMGAELWQIPLGFYNRLIEKKQNNPSFILGVFCSIVSLIRHLVLLLFFPNTNPIRSRKIFNKARSLVKQNNIDVVISTFVYYEYIYAGIKLKQKFKNSIKVVSYHLDLRTASASTSRITRNYIRRKALHSIIKESLVLDKILIPYSGGKDIEKIKDIEISKIEFVGFPVFLKPEIFDTCKLPYNKEDINICYIGSLSRDNRNPLPVLPLLENVSHQLKKKIVVYFWGFCDGMELEINQSPVASYQGVIDNRYSHCIMNNADFLLNVGNKITYDMMPSKVFGMFATGKPIINLVFHPQDATIPFFNRYGNSISLKMYDEASVEDKVLAREIEVLYNTTAQDCKEKFVDFTPGYICDKILN